MEDATKKAKEVAKKMFGGSKKFQGSGNKLGGGEGPVPANHPSARRPSEPTASPPQKAVAKAPVAVPNPARRLGFQDSAAGPSAPAGTLPAVPEAGSPKSAVEVTDRLSESAAMIVSSGPEGLKAAKTVCSVVSNVLKAPNEAKYRQLNCGNPRVAATLAIPGVHELFRELGFQHLQEASSSSGPLDPGMLNLPLRLPGPKEPLFHGALSLLHPAVAQATSATATPTPTPSAQPATDAAPAGTSAEPMDATAPATEAAAPVDTPMEDADSVATPQSGGGAAAQPPPAVAAPVMDWGDSGAADAAGPAPAVQSDGLGMSAAAWKAENKKNPRKAVMVGGVAVPATAAETAKPPPAQGPSRGVSGAAPAAAGGGAQEPEEDYFTGRNTKVLLPTAPDSEIPDSFFERTGRDLKFEWQRVKKQREQEQTLMTKAHREKLRMAGRKTHKYATVRVRFPEGIVLQGCFLPAALAFEVHAWVTDHLRALEPFELSSPVLASKDKKLAHGGTVKEAGLMPTCTLNFRWTPGGEPVRGPALSDETLKLAQMDV